MRILGILALLLILLPLATTTIAQDDPPTSANADCQYDLTGETITLYHFGDLSLIYTFITSPFVNGLEDAIDFFNANGGLCGATLVQEFRDTGASQEAAQAAWDEFSEREDANTMFLYLTEDAELLREQAREAQIPLIGATGSVPALYGEDGQTPGYVFAITPLYSDQLGAFCEYVSAEWDQFGIEGDPVIGHVSWLNAFGQSSDTDESRAYCESLGIGYAGAQYFFPGIPDISTQIQRVIDGGANIIYTTSLAQGPSQIAATLEGMEMRDEILLAGSNWVLDTSLIVQGGASIEGIIGQLPYVWWDEVEHPGIQVALNYWLENRLQNAEDSAAAFELRNIAYLLAWAAVDIYIDVYSDTLNRVGPGNVDGQAMYESYISGTEYVGLDGILRLSFDENRRAVNLSRIGTVTFIESDTGVTPQISPLTDFFEVPDLSPGGADVP